ncbi:MAG: hypothetical protein ACOYMA_00110 [Bacteroidia bacterium]
MNKKTPAALNETQQGIWDHIKNMKAEYYALKDMTVESICLPLNIDPVSLYLELKGPAALRSVEDCLNLDTMKAWSGKSVSKYVVELKDRFAVVSKNPEAK